MSTSSALAIAVSALASASSGGSSAETNNNSILSSFPQPMQVGNNFLSKLNYIILHNIQII